MQKNKRLRIFAGPNGSGKSTLFKEFKTLYNPGYFINADELEKSLSNSGLIDLTEIGLKATQKDLENFKKTKTAKSLITKASEEGKSIDIEVKENYIVDKAKNTHSYEASFAASFIRDLLYKNSKSFSFETVIIPDTGKYYFRASVVSFKAPGRFVMGILEEVQVLGSKEFIAYIKRIISKNT